MRRLGPPVYLFALAALAACSDGTEALPDAGLAPGSCRTDDDCPLDQHCEGGACQPGTGNACTTDPECGPGRECRVVTGCGATRCHGNTCVPKTCTSTSDCGTWVCTAGTCTACDGTHPCPPGSSCGTDGTCSPAGPPCMRDRDCRMSAPGTICVQGACVEPMSCTTSADCPPDLRCQGGTCREPCTSAMDCGPPFMWSCDVATGECHQRCAGDGTCPPGQICEMQMCAPAECMTDADCASPGASRECQGEENGHGRCVDVIRCQTPADCPEGTTCNTGTGTCQPLPRCVSDRSCAPDEYCENGFCRPSTSCTNTPCPMGFDCVGDVCVPAVCRGDEDCMRPELCIGGACTQPPPPTGVTQVRIITPAGVVRPGVTYAFTAVALDQTGRIIPGVSFLWASTSTRVAAIAQDGVATGGPDAGVTFITASVDTGATLITSAPVQLRNLGLLAADDVRVTVLAQANGAPVNGAAVELRGASVQLRTTGADGVATFTGAAALGPFTVTVAHAAFDFVSVLGVDARDLLVELPSLTRPNLAAGLRGTVDLSQVSGTGQLSLSLNGASIASPILAFNPAQLFGGDLFTVTIPNPMGGGNLNLQLPAGTTLEVEFGGATIPLKNDFFARATTGIRAAWSFGGKLGLDVFTGGGGGGGFDPVGAILPVLSRFDHGVRPVIDVLALPTVVDGPDIDGDGDTAELVPDWTNFPAVAMRPDTAQSLRYQLRVDNLPVVSGGNANTLIVVAGTLLPGVGFVPLGLDGLQDNLGNGIVPPFTTKIAPAHGGLEVGEYVVLVTAVRLAQGGLPGPGSARLVVASRLPTTVDVSDGWLDSPTDASWQENLRQIDLPPVQNGDYYRLAFASDDGGWHVFLPAPAGALSQVAVPPAPAGFVDRTQSATVSVDAVDLEAGTQPGGLWDVAAGGSRALDRVTRGFARATAGR